MAQLPATGTTISMGRATHAYYNIGPGVNTSIATRLNPALGRTTTSYTPFSAVFGGQYTPYSY
jgi:hypothetical protein